MPRGGGKRGKRVHSAGGAMNENACHGNKDWMTNDTSRFPDFKVDRTCAGYLSDQLYTGLRTAIHSEFYSQGGCLPSRERIAAHYGVSETVVRKALRQLMIEGLLVSHPKVGCIVKSPKVRKTFEKVLIAIAEQSGSYALNVCEAMIESVLIRAGYCPYSVKLESKRNGDIDRDLFRLALEHKPDFVVLYCSGLHSKTLGRIVGRYGIPYLVIGDDLRAQQGEIADICTPYIKPLEEVVEACRRAHVRNICQVDFGSNSPIMNIWNRLRSSEMFIERLSVDMNMVYANLERIQQASAEAMEQRLRRGPLPDLLFFVDDFLTMGALPVLLENGIRIPEDVKIITFANCGFGPVFTKSFARIAVDMRKRGKAIAEGLVTWFRTGVFPTLSPEGVPVYIPGETFPV